MLLRRKPRGQAPETTQAQSIAKMMRLRAAALHSVHKRKFRLSGCPLGDFDAWLETPETLPLVIRGEAGRFTPNGEWERTA